jgi:hypothetical protein
MRYVSTALLIAGASLMAIYYCGALLHALSLDAPPGPALTDHYYCPMGRDSGLLPPGQPVPSM